jgi:hypothetical protein
MLLIGYAKAAVINGLMLAYLARAIMYNTRHTMCRYRYMKKLKTNKETPGVLVLSSATSQHSPLDKRIREA